MALRHGTVRRRPTEWPTDAQIEHEQANAPRRMKAYALKAQAAWERNRRAEGNHYARQALAEKAIADPNRRRARWRPSSTERED